MTTPTPPLDPLHALDKAQNAVDASASAATGAMNVSSQGWSAELVQFLSVSVLVFTFGALLLGATLLWRSRASPSNVLRVFGVICIIGISALLLVVGYSNEQLTPIVGLFGAIAGYLLGKDSSNSVSPSNSTPTERRAET